MTRAYHKGWQDQRPRPTRRVRWYRPGTEQETIRLNFQDEFGEMNVYFVNPENAKILWDMFIADEISTRGMYTDMEMYEDEAFPHPR